MQNGSVLNERKAPSGRMRGAGVLAGFRQWGGAILRTQIAYGRVLGADRPEFQSAVAVEKLRTARLGALGLGILNLVGFAVYVPRLTEPALSQPFYHHLVSLYAMNIIFCLFYTLMSTFTVVKRSNISYLCVAKETPSRPALSGVLLAVPGVDLLGGRRLHHKRAELPGSPHQLPVRLGFRFGGLSAADTAFIRALRRSLHSPVPVACRGAEKPEPPDGQPG